MPENQPSGLEQGAGKKYAEWTADAKGSTFFGYPIVAMNKPDLLAVIGALASYWEASKRELDRKTEKSLFG